MKRTTNNNFFIFRSGDIKVLSQYPILVLAPVSYRCNALHRSPDITAGSAPPVVTRWVKAAQLAIGALLTGRCAAGLRNRTGSLGRLLRWDGRSGCVMTCVRVISDRGQLCDGEQKRFRRSNGRLVPDGNWWVDVFLVQNVERERLCWHAVKELNTRREASWWLL